MLTYTRCVSRRKGDGYPDYATLQSKKFQHSNKAPSNGKYGDPAFDPLWNFFVAQGGRGQDVDPSYKMPGPGNRRSTSHRAHPGPPQVGSSYVPEEASSSSAPPPVKKAKLEVAVDDGPPAASLLPMGARFEIGSRVNDSESKIRKAAASVSSERIIKTIKLTRADGSHDEGTLSLTNRSIQKDFVQQDEELKLRHFDDEDRVLFPIFMPSGGRPKTARLLLNSTMKSSGGPDDDWGYIQIICVKSREYESYLKYWPDHNFFALPKSADELGIGASRFWILNLARKICPDEFRFAFVMDDNVRSWKAVPMSPTDGNLHLDKLPPDAEC